MIALMNIHKATKHNLLHWDVLQFSYIPTGLARQNEFKQQKYEVR